MDKDNETNSVIIIEPTEPENLVVELDPAQLLLGMFDDAPDPIPFVVTIKYAFVVARLMLKKEHSHLAKSRYLQITIRSI